MKTTTEENGTEKTKRDRAAFVVQCTVKQLYFIKKEEEAYVSL